MIFWIEAAVLCALFTLMILSTCGKGPLFWIDDYPPAIRQRCVQLGLVSADRPALPPAVLARKAIACLAAAVLFGLMLVYINGLQTFWQGALTAYGLWLVVDWYDAFVIDCLWVCHSKRFLIPGTEDLVSAYHDYGFHIKMSGIGMVLGLPVCLLTGFFVWVFA